MIRHHERQIQHMKTMILSVALLAVVFLSMSHCDISHFSPKRVRPAGDITQKTQQVASFESITVSSGIQLVLTQGEQQDIVIEAYENLHELMVVSVKKGVLHLGFDDGVSINGDHKTTVRLSAPTIKRIAGSGGARIEIKDGLEADTFTFAISGGCEIVGDISCRDLTLSVSGGGRMTLSGSADNCTLNASGGGSVKAEQLMTDHLTAGLSGGASAHMRVNKTLSCTLSGGSRLYYIGDPSIETVVKSGGARLIKQ